MSLFIDKALMLSGGTDSFGNTVLFRRMPSGPAFFSVRNDIKKGHV